MLSSDLLLSIASFCFVVCAIPQIVRNLKFKNTITQSLFTNVIIIFGTALSLVAYVQLHVCVAALFLIAELVITGILIFQILLWRKNKKMKKKIERVEGARSFIHTLRGLK